MRNKNQRTKMNERSSRALKVNELKRRLTELVKRYQGKKVNE